MLAEFEVNGLFVWSFGIFLSLVFFLSKAERLASQLLRPIKFAALFVEVQPLLFWITAYSLQNQMLA